MRDLEIGVVDTMDSVRAKIGKIEEAMDHASPDVVTGMIFILYYCLCVVFHLIADTVGLVCPRPATATG